MNRHHDRAGKPIADSFQVIEVAVINDSSDALEFSPGLQDFAIVNTQVECDVAIVPERLGQPELHALMVRVARGRWGWRSISSPGRNCRDTEQARERREHYRCEATAAEHDRHERTGYAEVAGIQTAKRRGQVIHCGGFQANVLPQRAGAARDLSGLQQRLDITVNLVRCGAFQDRSGCQFVGA
jgi:hypothetical protein